MSLSMSTRRGGSVRFASPHAVRRAGQGLQNRDSACHAGPSTPAPPICPPPLVRLEASTCKGTPPDSWSGMRTSKPAFIRRHRFSEISLPGRLGAWWGWQLWCRLSVALWPLVGFKELWVAHQGRSGSKGGGVRTHILLDDRWVKGRKDDQGQLRKGPPLGLG